MAKAHGHRRIDPAVVVDLICILVIICLVEYLLLPGRHAPHPPTIVCGTGTPPGACPTATHTSTVTATGTRSPTPTARPTAVSSTGGVVQAQGALIQLHLLSPCPIAQPQDLWTIVQWEDGLGNWRDVEGWQGALDRFSSTDGTKAWTVAPNDLGAGPFRWAVFLVRGGEAAALSEPFDLPQSPGQTEIVEARVTCCPNCCPAS